MENYILHQKRILHKVKLPAGDFTEGFDQIYYVGVDRFRHLYLKRMDVFGCSLV